MVGVAVFLIFFAVVLPRLIGIWGVMAFGFACAGWTLFGPQKNKPAEPDALDLFRRKQTFDRHLAEWNAEHPLHAHVDGGSEGTASDLDSGGLPLVASFRAVR